jgi:rhamnulokinase
MTSYLAVDLGAESGRIIRGSLNHGTLALHEIHRFRHEVVPVAGTLRWDLLHLWAEVLAGLRAGADGEVRSLSVDAWGVDYVLVRGREPLCGLAFNYRDPRAQAALQALRVAPGEEFIYAQTGIQFIPLNSVYQLVADTWRDRGWVEGADGMLMIADWFHWLLCGRRANEETNASTTQLYDPQRRTWAWPLIERLDLPRALFATEVVRPGTVLGPLTAEVAGLTGLPATTPVIAGCTHDTASAVVAVPAEEGEDWAYLSSGTWSLLGVELSAPLLSAAARCGNFTNELGYGGSVRFLRNIIGLWLLQESRRQWERAGQVLDYDLLVSEAAQTPALRALIQPDDPRFLAPGDMPARIRDYCRETAQPEPRTPGEVIRCILESLALLYARHLGEIERITGRTIRVLHIVGGGSRNEMLNQFTANATGRTVLAGPVEATALGNVLVQAITLGDLPDLPTARQVVRASFPQIRYEPRDSAVWQTARARFAALPI